jgi:prepilin-type N-terminal cleavage/methylation domain-containing protein
MMKNNPQSGFTLIEVLIAATILFAVIAIVSQTYRGATIATQKATRSVALLGTVPLLLDTIEFRLKQADINRVISDEGILDEFRFKWTANVIKRAPPAAQMSPEDGEVMVFNDRFYLWNVVLSVTNEEYSQTFEFESLTWDQQ